MGTRLYERCLRFPLLACRKTRRQGALSVVLRPVGRYARKRGCPKRRQRSFRRLGAPANRRQHARARGRARARRWRRRQTRLSAVFPRPRGPNRALSAFWGCLFSPVRAWRAGIRRQRLLSAGFYACQKWKPQTTCRARPPSAPAHAYSVSSKMACATLSTSCARTAEAVASVPFFTASTDVSPWPISTGAFRPSRMAPGFRGMAFQRRAAA